MAGSSSNAPKLSDETALGFPLSIDSKDDDYDYSYDDCGSQRSELYGKYTWMVHNFSQINKKEIRSNAFEVGGYKWCILMYPKGCGVPDHLSIFLCVSNQDKLPIGWSHYAQFTASIVNFKDPKKSSYSDTLHRFWKKEHDWGWKNFLKLAQLSEGFLDDDTLTIKVQIQVIRKRRDGPFQCLDRKYRSELLRVYLVNVEEICGRFVEEKRGRFKQLVKDKIRWSSFCSFWSGIDQNSRDHWSREKSDSILPEVVKHFFIEKEVTSALVMESLYTGLTALEEPSTPIVRMVEGSFVLADDLLPLLEKEAMEPMAPKAGDSGEYSMDRDEKRLAELGRRIIETFVLAHIFRSCITRKLG